MPWLCRARRAGVDVGCGSRFVSVIRANLVLAALDYLVHALTQGPYGHRLLGIGPDRAQEFAGGRSMVRWGSSRAGRG